VAEGAGAELESQTALGLARLVRSGQVSAEEICGRAVERAESVGAPLGAFLSIDRERALADARKIDAELAAGRDPGPLAGVPVAVKDSIAVEGWSLSCGSKILESFRAPEDSTVWARLRAAGAICVGRTNMDEFAMGSSNENSAFGPVRNPWNLEMVPGGSSGGSAAAVSAGIVPIALGSDTGGSVRQPAAFCGVYGFKPTYGLLSRYGLVAFGSSLDQIGPIARSVDDLRIFVSLAAGPDAHDSTALPRSTALDARPIDSLAGKKIGIMKEASVDRLEASVSRAFQEGVDRLVQAGAEVVSISVPTAPYSIAVYYIIANAEASSNLARFDGIRYGLRVDADTLAELYERSREAGFGPEVKRRILTGTFVLSAGYAEEYYERAQNVRRRLARDFEEAFRQVDFVVTPTTPTAAFGIGEKTDDPLTMYLSDVYTVPASLVGLPAIAVPSGFDERGLPLSLQILGPAGGDAAVLDAARLYEKISGAIAAIPPGI